MPGCTCAATTARTPSSTPASTSISAPSGCASSLGWKSAQNGAGPRIAEADDGARERHERRHVHVVPAGVHAAVDRREADPRLLDDRQPVELGAHDHGRRAAAGAYEQPRADHVLCGRRERPFDEGGGPALAVAELGHRVQPATQLERCGKLVVDERQTGGQCTEA